MIALAGLPAFLDSWRALRPRTRDPVGRLATFLRLRSAIARLEPGDGRDGVTAQRLASIIATLQPALAAARAGGAGFNIIALAGLGRHEVRNAYALARLLDPREPHRLGPTLLAGLFDALDGAGATVARPADLTRCQVTVEHRPLGSERDRVDLLIAHSDLLLYLEIKIDAAQGDRQLDRYLETAAAEAEFRRCPAWCLAFLAPGHRTGLPAGVPALRWRTLANAMRRRLENADADAFVTSPVLHLLDHFSRL